MDAEILQEIKDRCVGTNPKIQLEDHEGIGNRKLDRPIRIYDVRTAIHDLHPKSSPGLDSVKNKMIHSLGDVFIEALAKYMNQCWEAGRTPRQWKTARRVLIPKPGKKLHLEASVKAHPYP